MAVIIRILELVNGEPSAHDGKFVKEYDPGPPDYPLGECYLETTVHKQEAKVYASPIEALEEWRKIDPRQPVRIHDGKPNRPRTAYTCETIQV